MDNTSEIEKSTPISMVENIEYAKNEVASKMILKKTTGNVRIIAFDTEEGQMEKTTPFDTLLQIIDGEANIFISGNSHILNTGQSIVIPAHTSNYIKPNGRFKMIETTIKSGY